MTYQVLEDTLVELPLLGTALVQLVVVVLKAVPVGAECLKTVGVDVGKPAVIICIQNQFQSRRQNSEKATTQLGEQ